MKVIGTEGMANLVKALHNKGVTFVKIEQDPRLPKDYLGFAAIRPDGKDCVRYDTGRSYLPQATGSGENDTSALQNLLEQLNGKLAQIHYNNWSGKRTEVQLPTFDLGHGKLREIEVPEYGS